MKIRQLTMVFAAALVMNCHLVMTKADAQTLFSSANEADQVYTQLVEESDDWKEVNGVKVDPILEIDTPAELEARLDQGYVLTTVDPATGEITRVTELQLPVRVHEHPNCENEKACLTPKVPYTWRGFSGKGTKTGTWSRYVAYHTGKYRARFSWIYQGRYVQGPWQNKYTGTLIDTNRGVTFKSVSLK